MEDRILMDTHRTQKLVNNIKKQDNIYNDILLDVRDIQLHKEKSEN
jgi:hypothetical protein